MGRAHGGVAELRGEPVAVGGHEGPWGGVRVAGCPGVTLASPPS